MKFLIYGGKGWIGSQFINILKQNPFHYEYISGESRVDNLETLKKELAIVKPSHIVSFIGRTHGKIGNKVYSTIDYLEQPGKLKENIRDNLYSSVCLAILCKEQNIHLTYIGTGCIFKFDETHPFGEEKNGFTEKSIPNFFGSEYSIVKGFTDRIMKLFPKTVLNLRIRMPITDKPNARNLITKLIKYEKICSIPNSMSILPELLPIALKLAESNVTGTFNLTNPGLISHNEILELYKEIVDSKFTWKNFSLEEQSKILAADRSNNYLDTNKLQSLYPKIKNIKTSLHDILLQYKAHL